MFYFDSNNKSEAFINGYFSGIAYSRNDIVLSLDGLKKYLIDGKNPLDLKQGRYSLSYFDIVNNSYIVTTDLTGQDALFYYKKDGFWAISNSLYKLAEELKAQNKVLNIHYPALYSYKIRHSLGQQPISNNTIIENIKIIPRDCYIEIKNNGLEIRKKHYEKITLNNDSDYFDSLHNTLSEQASLLKALIDCLPQGSIRCDLTGGFDSRFIFSIALNAGLLDRIRVSSNKKKEDDYFIANYITKFYGIPLDNRALTNDEPLKNESLLFQSYKYGNSGIYNGGVYKVTYNKEPNTLHIYGAGGEALRGLYVGTPRQVISRLNNHFAPGTEEYEIVKSEFFGYFESNNLDINDSESMLIHARNFHSRFHFGRNWYRSLTNPLFSPMTNVDLETLADYASKKYGCPKSIFYQTYLLLDNSIAFFPFDLEGKDLQLNRLKNLTNGFSDKRKIYTTKYNIYGQLGDSNIVISEFSGSANNNKFEKTFNDLADEEKKLFIEKYPKNLHCFSKHLPIYTLLNLLV